MYGETNQANYLINAKDRNSETKCRRELFNDRTNQAPSALSSFEKQDPVSPFRDQSNKVSSIRNDYGQGANSPVKSFDYRI